MLVSVIGSRGGAHSLRRSMLYDVAQIGFMVVGAALVPYALHSVGFEKTVVWRSSSFALMVIWILAVSLAYRRFHRVGSIDDLIKVLSPALFRINPVVVAAGNLLLLWNTLFPSSYSGARYIAAILLLLLIATYIFLRAGFAADEESD